MANTSSNIDDNRTAVAGIVMSTAALMVMVVAGVCLYQWRISLALDP